MFLEFYMDSKNLYLFATPFIASITTALTPLFFSSNKIAFLGFTFYHQSFYSAIVPVFLINFFIALAIYHLNNFFPLFCERTKYTRWFENSKSGKYYFFITNNNDEWHDIKYYLTRESIEKLQYEVDCPPITPFSPVKRQQTTIGRGIIVIFIILVHSLCTIFIIQILNHDIPETFSYFGVVATAGITLVSLLSQQRLNARSKNRIRWINDLRLEMSSFFGALGWMEHADTKDIITEWRESTTSYRGKNQKRCRIKETTDDLMCKSRFSLMSKLELMLNPSEKAHRTLIALMRLALGNDNLRVDKCIFLTLGITTNHNYNKRTNRKYIPDHKKYIVSYGPQKITQDELISMIFRLAQIVLKKEWEQVKNVS